MLSNQKLLSVTAIAAGLALTAQKIPAKSQEASSAIEWKGQINCVNGKTDSLKVTMTPDMPGMPPFLFQMMPGTHILGAAGVFTLPSANGKLVKKIFKNMHDAGNNFVKYAASVCAAQTKPIGHGTIKVQLTEIQPSI